VQAVKRQVSTTLAEQVLAREALGRALGDRVRASLPRETQPAVSVRGPAGTRTGFGIRSFDGPAGDRIGFTENASGPETHASRHEMPGL